MVVVNILPLLDLKVKASPSSILIDVASTGGGKHEPIHLQTLLIAGQRQKLVFCVDLLAACDARVPSLTSSVETRAVGVRIRAGFREERLLTFLNINSLGEVVNVHHKSPFILKIESFPGKDDLLSAGAQLFILNTEEPGANQASLEVLTLPIKHLLEQLASNCGVS